MIAQAKKDVRPIDKPVVLIVDDEPQILDALEDLLEDEFEVVTASRGEDALSELTRRQVSVVLSDQRMPGLSGDQLLMEARLCSDATRLLVTGYSDISAVIRAVNNGQIYAYVSKPWKAVDLKLLVRKAADHHRLKRRYFQQAELLDRLMNQFPDHIYFKDHEGRFLSANHAFSSALGVADPSQLSGKTHLEVLVNQQSQLHHQEDLEVICHHTSVLNREEPWTTPTGESIWMSVTKLPLAGAGLVCIARDITERRRLATEREVFFDNSSDLMAVFGFDGSITQLNPSWERVLGWNQEELQSKPLLEFVHPEDRDRTKVEMSFLASFEGHRTTGFENRCLHRDGSYRWLMWTSAAVPEGSRIYAAGRDISERKREERHLVDQVRQQHFLAGLAQLALEGVDLQVVYDQAVQIVSDHLQTDCCDIVRIVDGVPQRISGVGSPVGESSRTPGAEAASPIIDHEPWGVLRVLSHQPRQFREEEIDFLGLVSSVLSLVVRRKRSQEELDVSQRQLFQSQKLEAIGMMAGGIAHDFNNILTIIRGNAEQLTPSDETDEIVQAAEKATALIKQLLTFARQQPIHLRPVELNETVRSDEKLLRRLLSEDIKMTVTTTDQPAWTVIDPSHLTQVLANLVSNARDAIDSDGEIVIRVFRGESQVGVEVHDTGAGISGADLDKIFQPFFTTKPVGKGTGLGLATSYGIIKQSGGTLEVRSVLGVGTTFTLLLPATDKASGPRDAVVTTTRVHVGQGTVLLVDDEESIVRLFARVLRKAGYLVYETASSERALEIAQTLGERIDFLVSDTVMPNLGGKKLAEEVRKLHPDVKVLLTSGYSERSEDDNDDGLPFLAKPFSAIELLLAVEKLL